MFGNIFLHFFLCFVQCAILLFSTFPSQDFDISTSENNKNKMVCPLSEVPREFSWRLPVHNKFVYHNLSIKSLKQGKADSQNIIR